MQIRRLTPADAPAYRVLRLRALREHPQSYTSSFDEEQGKPLANYEQRLAGATQCKFWGAFMHAPPHADPHDGPVLAGVVGLEREQRAKSRHKALVIGMYVASEQARQGLARALLDALLADARASGVALLVLTVTRGNAGAERLYLDAGFASFGVEPGAIKVDNQFLDKNHMFLRLAPS